MLPTSPPPDALNAAGHPLLQRDETGLSTLSFDASFDADSSLVELVRERLPRDGYLSNMVPVLGVSLYRLITLCRRHGVPYPNRHATQAEIDAVVQAVCIDGLSIREAARVVGISRSAAHRYVAERRSAVVSRAGVFRPLSVSAYRCPRHGLVTQSPCVACESLAARGEVAA